MVTGIIRFIVNRIICEHIKIDIITFCYGIKRLLTFTDLCGFSHADIDTYITSVIKQLILNRIEKAVSLKIIKFVFLII